MSQSALRIPLELGDLGSTSGRYEQPGEPGVFGKVAVLFAHGSNYDLDSPWTRALVTGLLKRGLAVLSFNYAYRERLRRADVGKGASPAMDSLELLEHVHCQALRELHRLAPDSRILLAGKSLGARLSTLLAAKGERCHGLMLFGYPLHSSSFDPTEAQSAPAASKGKHRIYSEHFATLVQPTLFLQGTRDPFCDLDTLRRELARFGGDTCLEVIDDADHGFYRPADGEQPLPSSIEELAERAAAWTERTWVT